MLSCLLKDWRRQPQVWLLGVFIVVALGLHIWLAHQLNIVEDESAYLQDAAQINWHFLPFREFGATKGPLFLVLLKWWGQLFGQTIMAGRLFVALAHLLSIPVLYILTKNISRRPLIAILASGWWALSPVVVSLTTNVTHIPYELLFILSALAILSSSRPYRRSTLPTVAVLLLAALLTRATAIVFAPVVLYVLCLKTKSYKPVLGLLGYFVGLLVVLIMLIYPLYGWPKTAFFFNIDATLIAQKQRAVYDIASLQPSIPVALFNAALPVWRDSLPLLGAVLLVPFAWNVRRRALRFTLAVVWLFVFYYFTRGVLADVQWTSGPMASLLAARVFLALWAVAGTIIILKPQPARPRFTHLAWLIVIWLISFILFYRGWGRQPTPFYPLESIPALAMAASVATWFGLTTVRAWTKQLQHLVFIGVTILLSILTVTAYQRIPLTQYRGTVTVEAARAVAQHLQELLPRGEEIFTAQPIFAYLSYRPVYLGLTHPGWYLAERAGFMPSAIRRVFFPDFDQLATSVARDIDWMVVDWRTNDVYFNDKSEQTKPFRELLKNDFEPVVTVPNPASRDITIYHRVTR